MSDQDDDLIYTVSNTDEPDFESISEPRGLRYPADNPQIAPVLELLSQRWTLTIIRAVYNGNSRFNAISRQHGINPNTLKARLRELEEEGIVTRVVESHLPPKVIYSLSPKGIELAQIFESLYEWSQSHDSGIAVPAVVFESTEAEAYDPAANTDEPADD